MSIDKIAIWVHPLWSSWDLGQPIVDGWQRNIKQFSEDSEFAFILTGCPEDSCHNVEWYNRVIPIIRKLPEMFDGRYIRWPENYVEGRKKEHVDTLIEQFKLPQIDWHEYCFPIGRLFREGRVDGLIRYDDLCVSQQMRDIRLICCDVRYWKMD